MSTQVTDFIHEANWGDLPVPIQNQARRCLLDTLGAAVAGRKTRLSQIIHDYSASVHAGTGAQLWLDGRDVSPPGAALANGMTIDALDIHDGYTLTKGHAGAALIPASLSTVALGGPISGQDFLAALVVGYEVALRAGLALHATACDYHTSGAWNALGCAAIIARRLGLGADHTRHALGVAEYHGPRSQMMRCIDHPTMLKDGSGWGAMTGVSAAILAGDGFTGAPALTVDAVEVADFWTDLGDRWLIAEQYFKPYAICRWAQPAIAGALNLRKQYEFDPETVRSIRVTTFHEAVRLANPLPQTTEEAQYSLPFPVATALVHRQLGPAELSGQGLHHPLVLQLAQRVELVEDPAHSARFPEERFAQVQIELEDGKILNSGEVEATWGVEDPPSDKALREKFRWLARTCLSKERVKELEMTIWQVADLSDVNALCQLLGHPLEKMDQ
ncbi:MAG: MmgE/PrpD family protein [Chloroflexota bacterium]|nr:MAG: MmgE/PrpD family protein [Chloroflexota bacterium]